MSESQNHVYAFPAQFNMPMDVTCMIFEDLRNTYRPDEPLSNPKFESSLRWIPEATHVCHSWREAALSAHSLWTNINVVASIPWAFEFARRSGNAPIRLIVLSSPGGIRHPKFFGCVKTLVHENIQRIWEMSLRHIDVNEKTLIMSALSDGAHKSGTGFYPILEDLQISLKHPNTMLPFLLTNDMLCAPELKRLSLVSCFVGVDFGPLQNLSQLTISVNPFYDVVNRLHKVFLQTPNLEKLTLLPDGVWTLPPCPVLDSSRIQPAILPNLRHIDIRGWGIEQISAILQVISDSDGPQRILHISPELYRGEDELLSLFTRIMSHATETSIRQLDLSIYPSSLIGLWLNAWRGDSECPPDIGLATPLCSQNAFLSRLQIEFDIVKLLVELLRRMNHQDLQTLVLDLAEILPLSTWVQLFGTLPSLASIDVSWCGQELFGALIDGIGDMPTHSEHTDSIGSSAPTALPFQALKEIKVSRWKLYREEDIDFMLKCLRKRLDLGMGLKKLIFRLHDHSESGVSDLKSQLNAFKDVVEVVFIGRT